MEKAKTVKKAEKTKATLCKEIGQQMKLISKRDDFIRENIKRDVAQNTRLDFIALLGWIGSILLCLSPLFNLVVWCSLAILGLSLLTIQAYKNKVYNLLFSEHLFNHYFFN